MQCTLELLNLNIKVTYRKLLSIDNNLDWNKKAIALDWFLILEL